MPAKWVQGGVSGRRYTCVGVATSDIRTGVLLGSQRYIEHKNRDSATSLLLTIL
jgi:hypothetical protein